jgi:hypothetical protein
MKRWNNEEGNVGILGRYLRKPTFQYSIFLVPTRPFPAHLLADDPGKHAPGFGLQHGFSVDTPKQV